MVVDEEEYGVEEFVEEEEVELVEEVVDVGEVIGVDKDVVMEGVEGENGVVDEEEFFDDGSVDIEGESEDDFEEEEFDGDVMEIDEMEVDKFVVFVVGVFFGVLVF